MRVSQMEDAFGRGLAALPAPLILMAAITCLSAGSGYSKIILTSDNLLAFGFVRVALGAIILLVLARPDIRNMDARQWRDVTILGFVIAIFKIVDLYALVAMPLGLMVTIGFLGPLAVSLSDARRPLDFVWPLMGFAGVVLLAPLGENSSLSWVAIGFGLLSALAWGSYILISARVGKTMRGIEGFAVANVIAMLVLMPFGLKGSAPFFADSHIFLTMLFITLLAILPLGLEFMALKRLSPHAFGVLLSLEPAIASILGMLILGEMLGMIDWLAVGIVSAASIGATLFRPAHRPAAGETLPQN